MKYVILILFLTLVAASGWTALSMPEQKAGKPILYWVTDANPARIKQIDLFHQWMIENGHRAADGSSAVELRLDTANSDPTKRIIQSVSGVAGDLMDMRGGGEMRFFNSMGVLAELTADAPAMGFDLSHTYAAAGIEISDDGKQYAFPCNVSTHGYWVNKDVFAKYGVAPPTMRWTLDEFERIGKELCDKANAGKSRLDVFFCSQVEYQILSRSVGLDRYNETMTRCAWDDPRFEAILERAYKWTYVDHIMPTPEDEEAFAAQAAGFGGNWFQLFNRGNYALLYSGRYALVQFREFNALRRARGENPMHLAVVEPPHGGFPNTNIIARAAAVYKGSPNEQIARLFLQFLASREYNMQIVDDGDSLPPNPLYTRVPEYTHPPDFPEEWGVHEPFAAMAGTIAVENAYSPFLSDRTAMRIQGEVIGAFIAHRLTARQAARQIARRINDEIDRGVAENPELAALYARRCAEQQRIDELRAKRLPIPRGLIANPFHLAYDARQAMRSEG